MGHRIQAKLTLSKVIPHGMAPVRLGRYTLIPSSASRSEITLDFLDEYVDRTGSGGSHPEEEARIVSDILAMLLNVQIRRVGFQIDDIVVPAVVEQQRQLQAFPEAHGALDFALVDHLSIVSNLEQDVLLQYVRACRAYATALTVVHYDAAFAFMLLVVSIECLASQAKVFSKADLPLGQNRNRFLRFAKEFAGDLGVDDEVSDQLLRSVYDDLRSHLFTAGRRRRVQQLSPTPSTAHTLSIRARAGGTRGLLASGGSQGLFGPRSSDFWGAMVGSPPTISEFHELPLNAQSSDYGRGKTVSKATYSPSTTNTSIFPELWAVRGNNVFLVKEAPALVTACRSCCPRDRSEYLKAARRSRLRSDRSKDRPSVVRRWARAPAGRGGFYLFRRRRS